MRILEFFRQAVRDHAARIKEAVKPPAVRNVEAATKEIRATTDRIHALCGEEVPAVEGNGKKEKEDPTGGFRLALDK